MSERQEYLINKVLARQASRDWNQFRNTTLEQDAVQFLYRDLIKWFDKRDIRPRINASKAKTFDELLKAISSAKYF